MILIAGVGYHNLRDMSFGPVLIERLLQEPWPPGIDIADLSYGPIAVLHTMDEWPPYRRLIFVAGVRRQRQPGGVYCYRWEHQLPGPEDIQARVAEALMGVVSLDNLLIIATYFGKLPGDVVIIEVEARDDGWGSGFTPEVEAAIPEVRTAIQRYADASCTLPEKP
jgi:hydrogenase maturation protease